MEICIGSRHIVYIHEDVKEEIKKLYFISDKIAHKLVPWFLFSPILCSIEIWTNEKGKNVSNSLGKRWQMLKSKKQNVNAEKGGMRAKENSFRKMNNLLDVKVKFHTVNTLQEK